MTACLLLANTQNLVSVTCDVKVKNIYLQLQLYCTTKLLFAMALDYSTLSLSFKNLYNTKIQQNSILDQVNTTIFYIFTFMTICFGHSAIFRSP